MPREFISNTTKRSVLEAVANELSTPEILRKFNLKSRCNIYRMKNDASVIPSSIQQNWTALLELSKVRAETRVRMIKDASDTFLKAIKRCCSDLLKGVVPLSDQKHIILSNYKDQLRSIVRSDMQPRSIRRYLVKKGSEFIPVVLGPVLDFYT